MSIKHTNILFRADSSSSIGTGHIMRDLVLASSFEAQEIVFATQQLEGNINTKIVESSYTLEFLKNNELIEFTKIIQRYNPSLIVIDNYSIDYAYEKELKSLFDGELLVLDDTYEKHYCDILLNHNIYAKKEKYNSLVPSFCEVRCGEEFTLIREEFHQAQDIKKTPTLKTEILLAMGGSDSSNINPEILTILQGLTNIHVSLITTKANAHLEELQKLCGTFSWVSLHINTTKVAQLMRNADCAIITPSVTANEVLFMQVPLIAIKTASNQDEMFEYLQEKEHAVLECSELHHLEKTLLKILGE